MNRTMVLWLAAAAIVVACAIAYWPVFSAEFVNFDDGAYVYSNVDVRRGLSWNGVAWAFSEVYAANWHPLTWLSHMADVTLFGLDARGHHAANLLLHTVNAVLLFFLLQRLTSAAWASATVALLFAVHPVNVESVAWISERKNILSTLFGFLTIWAYAGYVDRRSWRLYVVSLACFALSLMAKQMLVTMPFILLLLDYWPLGRAQFGAGGGDPVRWRSLLFGWLRLLPEKLPFFALTAAASAVTLAAQQVAMMPLVYLSFGMRLANALVAYLAYLRMAVWPTGLAIFYPHPRTTPLPQAIAAGAAILLISALALWFGRRYRYLLVGWFWYLGTLVPVIGLVQVGGQARADRYLYIPLIGIFVIVVWGLRDLVAWLAPSRRTAFTTVGAGLSLLSLVLVWKTHRQAATWHDTISLFTQAINSTERNYLAHGNLAATYFATGRFDTAVEHCDRAIEYNPGDFDARLILGLALAELSSTDRALVVLNEAMQIRPQNPLPIGQYGILLADAGKLSAAQPYLKKAVELADNLPDYGPLERKVLHRNWAHVLARGKRFREALERYAIALELDPEYVEALRESAEVEFELGNPAEAIARLESAVSIDENDRRSLALLGTILAQQGKFDQARQHLERAVDIDPDQPDTRIKLGKVLRALGIEEQARDQFLAAIADDDGPAASDEEASARGSAEAHVQLGQISSARGELDQALRHYELALVADESNAEANNDLAWLLATRAQPSPSDADRAVMLATRACESTGFRQPAMLGTLAAAQAAAGNYHQAVELADYALLLARADAQHAWIIEQLEQQIAAHREGRPWIETPAP